MSLGAEVLIVDRLEAISAVTAITSRIRVDHLIPKDTYPAIVVTMTGETPIDELTGLTGKVYTEVDVQCIAEDKTTSRRLEWAARYGLITQTGAAAGLADWEGTINSKSADDVLWTGTTTSIDEPDDGNAIPLYITTGTYRVMNDNPA